MYASKLQQGIASRLARTARRLAIATSIAALGVSAASAPGASAAPFAYEPINIERIELPSSITEASDPVFARDNKHVLFWSGSELWITTLGGAEVHCLSCGLANDPKPEKSEQEGLTTPFPDGKRIYFGGYGNMAVLTCSPSVVNCASASILPVDFSKAQPKLIGPGGAVSGYTYDIGGAATPKLAPDGEHVAFSDVRTDSVESMVIAKLVKTASKYEVTDARVINPPGPTSAADPSLAHWSESASLDEFKTFTNGGADATYVETGGAAGGNPDVYSVNLATGQRTRLTADPDWDEDNAVSPNGELLALWSNRTDHYTDVAGLLPYRDFIESPGASMGAVATVSTPEKRECAGPVWLLPSSGDDGATLAGEPIVYYDGKIHVTNNITGWPQWSPNGTMLALDTQSEETHLSAPYLLIAKLTARKPSRRLPVVNSEPGAWAPEPYGYHGALGFDGTITLHGAGGGTVTVNYGGTLGALQGEWSETYENYSENGTDFLNGTKTIKAPESISAGGTVTAHLTMTGADTGRLDEETTNSPEGVTGHIEATYDGHTVQESPEVSHGPCPSKLPAKPKLQLSATSLGGGSYEVKVTASVAEVGPNETQTSTSPVNHALVRLGRKKSYTNDEGVAVVNIEKSHELTVEAGETLVPTSAYLE